MCQCAVSNLSMIMDHEPAICHDQDYRKTNKKLPDDIKKKLPGAVKEPARFIVGFLKKDSQSIHQNFSGIYRGLSGRYVTEDELKKKQFEKNLKRTQDQWRELTNEQLKDELNRHDFLKASWLQYLLYAYRNHVNEMEAADYVQTDAFQFGISP